MLNYGYISEIELNYQIDVELNQYKAQTFESCYKNSVNTNKVETIVNNINSKIPESEFDNFVLNLINNSCRGPLAEEEKGCYLGTLKQLGIANRTYTIGPYYKNESMLKRDSSRRIDNRTDEREISNCFQNSTNTSSVQIFLIAIGQNKDKEIRVEKVVHKDRVETDKAKIHHLILN
ncbi:hypothetical protein F8M41_017851 [Gigaspora margarita]|uniref:Uncharacterized protein n=1 Tax=Gigaspora margarita TaxID=4874 RepID=A0A8H4AMJ3_GIGMA|nr:hypothetical protein F8M41_017851 [Gigaspora margarita]